MKKLFYPFCFVLAIAACALIFLQSCKQDEHPDATAAATAELMKIKADFKTYLAVVFPEGMRKASATVLQQWEYPALTRNNSIGDEELPEVSDLPERYVYYLDIFNEQQCVDVDNLLEMVAVDEVLNDEEKAAFAQLLATYEFVEEDLPELPIGPGVSASDCQEGFKKALRGPMQRFIYRGGVASYFNFVALGYEAILLWRKVDQALADYNLCMTFVDTTPPSIIEPDTTGTGPIHGGGGGGGGGETTIIL